MADAVSMKSAVDESTGQMPLLGILKSSWTLKSAKWIEADDSLSVIEVKMSFVVALATNYC